MLSLPPSRLENLLRADNLDHSLSRREWPGGASANSLSQEPCHVDFCQQAHGAALSLLPTVAFAGGHCPVRNVPPPRPGGSRLGHAADRRWLSALWLKAGISGALPPRVGAFYLPHRASRQSIRPRRPADALAGAASVFGFAMGCCVRRFDLGLALGVLRVGPVRPPPLLGGVVSSGGDAGVCLHRNASILL